MRFRKGSKVEVFSNKEALSGSWYPAKIINGNGHYYMVKYDEEVVGLAGIESERVPRKAIRPSPPPVQPLEGLGSGDVVEVLNRFSWKVATVLRALQTGWFLVRLFGSSQVVEVSKADVRPGLFWQGERWNVIDKGSINCEERPNVPSLPNQNQKSHQMETTASIHLKASRIPSSKMNTVPKKRKLENSNRLNEAHAAVSSEAAPVKKCIHPSTRRSKGCSKKKLARERMDGAAACSLGVGFDYAGANSITSSVASCGMSKNNTHQIPQDSRLRPFEGNADYSSDAESYCQNRLEEGNIIRPMDKNLTTELHRIELQGYRTTMEAFYASGPLSWEQETLLTDLRDSLHISNDEHLMELRTLFTSSTCFPSS